MPSLVVPFKFNKKGAVQVKADRPLIYWFIRGSTIRTASTDDIDGKMDATIFCAFDLSAADGRRTFIAVTDNS